MPQRNFWRAVLILVLCFAVATPARADSLERDAGLIIAGIVAVAAGITIGVVVLVVHYSKKSITGCVVSNAGGLWLTNEGDKRTYTLAGDTAGVTAGNRIKLQGKRLKSKGPEKTLVWEATKVTRDFGVCPQ